MRSRQFGARDGLIVDRVVVDCFGSQHIAQKSVAAVRIGREIERTPSREGGIVGELAGASQNSPL